MPEKDRRRNIIVLLTAVVAVSAVALLCVGKPLIRFVSDADVFRGFVEAHTWWSRVAYLGMLIFQVVFAVIPGGAFEVAGGYAFGALEGTILSVIGTTMGSALVFLTVRRWGLKYVLLFFTQEQLDSAKFMHDEKRLYLVAFIAFIIPGTPKDLLCYVAGLTDIRLSRWIIITSIARIPAITISTIGGNAIGTKSYLFAAVVFAVTVIISAVGVLIYRRITKVSEPETSDES